MIIRDRLNPKDKIIVRKQIKINGRVFSPGTFLDWTRLSIAWRKVLIMFDGGFVERAPKVVEKPAKKKTIKKATKSQIKGALHADDIEALI